MATEREVRLSGLRQRTRSREILITENGANADLSTREKNSSYRLRDHGEPSASNGFQKINDAVPGIALFVLTKANLDFKQFFFIWMPSSIIGRVPCLARVANDRTYSHSDRTKKIPIGTHDYQRMASTKASNDGFYVFLSINENT